MNSIEEKIQDLEIQVNRIQEQMNDINVLKNHKLCKELGTQLNSFSGALDVFKEYRDVSDTIKELSELSGYEEDIKNLSKRQQDLLSIINLESLKLDKDINYNVITIEVTPGIGGNEAGLFGGDIFNMYIKYCNNKKITYTIISEVYNGGSILKKGIIRIQHYNIFLTLYNESGVHRVQRIPATESSGRLHTSTACVNVMPEFTNISTEITDSDIKIDVYRASGAGGQHVNTTNSAVRITHIPTGIVVHSQDSRSQHQNKENAMEELIYRVRKMETEKYESNQRDFKNSQIISRDRQAKIRTYNFPRSDVKDHRSGYRSSNIQKFLNGEELDDLFNSFLVK